MWLQSAILSELCSLQLPYDILALKGKRSRPANRLLAAKSKREWKESKGSFLTLPNSLSVYALTAPMNTKENKP